MEKFTLTFVLFTLIYLTNAQVINLDIKVFIEGPFNGTEMNINLYNLNLLPLDQPYNVSPWNYNGTEQVASIPNPDIVDWILIELRETSGSAATAIPPSVIARQACFLLKNGQIVDLDGVSLPQLNLTILDDLYVVIRHRNQLDIMSSVPLTETTGTYDYDFTDDISKAYLDGQKEIGTGIYGMIAGDCDGNGIVGYEDKNDNWKRLYN